MRVIPEAVFVSLIWPVDLAPEIPPLDAEERTRGLFLPDLHPRPPVYSAYAAHLRDALVAARLLPTGSAASPRRSFPRRRRAGASHRPGTFAGLARRV